MFDIKAIRENPGHFDKGWQRRGKEAQSAELLDLDNQYRNGQTTLQDLQSRRNELSKEIGKAKSQGLDVDDIIAEVADIKKRLPTLEEEVKKLGDQLTDKLSRLDNIPDEDVPDGESEDDNVEIRQVGNIPEFDFAPKQHFEIGEKLAQMDFDAAAQMSGARFVVLKGDLARLERALSAFMLDLHTTQFGYQEVSPPVLVRDHALYGTSQLPKFKEDLFETTSGHFLIPTAEVSLTNLVREQILEEEKLPIRFAAMTQCFRSEAGAAGRDTRGMIRLHQFNKVEMVSVTTAEQSTDELERMTSAAEEVLKQLGLAYRVVMLCAGDMGFAARKTYDLEVWLPGQGAYREISSCSNTGDFQSRRMRARCRPANDKKTRFVHTLNGSGLAIGRTLVAVMENYQQEDGSILIPDVLQPYLGGQKIIEVN
ncbi:MAG: serine--tRNA ligase [Kordiimonas sp.]|nr:serine--tRNA ligase [Kordiimonas sp.]|tara:strand:- start:338 stop:1612 length:1275 start_codon:yes stop_codon:yes gene_type:complete